MGERGDLTVEPVDADSSTGSTISSITAAELVDALTNAVSSLGLHGRSGSSVDEPDRVPATT